jgi:Fe-S-cluster containining protein
VNKQLPLGAMQAQKKAKRNPQLLKIMYDTLKQLGMISNPIERIKALHKQLDFALEKSSPSVTCTKGCPHCCYHLINLAEDEAKLLNQHVSKLDSEQKHRLQKQKDHLLHEKDWEQLDYSDRACVFLKDNSCSVYEDRPLVCRVTQVESEPENCIIEKKQPIEPYYQDEAYIMLAAYYSLIGVSSPLAVSLDLDSK